MPALPSTGLIPISSASYTITGLIPGRKYLIILASSNWGTATAIAAFNIGESEAFVNAAHGTFSSAHTEDTFIAPSDTLQLTTSNMTTPIQARIILCKDA